MIRSLAPIVLVFSLVAQPSPDAEKDKALLQGTWVVQSLEREGKKSKEKAILGMKMIFVGDKLTIQRGSRILGVGTFKVDPSQKPKIMDYKEAKDIISPYDAAIYQIEGDILKICSSADQKKRPKEFDSKQGLNFVLQREKKGK